MNGQKFIDDEHRSMVLIDEHPEALLDKFEFYQPPTGDKARWVLQMTHNTGAH